MSCVFEAMVCRADLRQYVGPPTVEAIAQMLKGGVQVNTNRLLTLEGHDVVNIPPLCRS